MSQENIEPENHEETKSPNEAPVTPNQDGTKAKKKRKLTKQQRNYIFYILLILVVTGLTLYFVLKNDVGAVFEVMSRAKVGPILIMFAIVLGAFILEGLILTVFARFYKRKYHLYQGVFNGLIGVFFSDITPFASGGQFVQAYTFSKQGVKVANSASILVMHFIVYQTVIVLYGAVAFIFGYNSTIKAMGNVNFFGIQFSPIALSAIGFCINIFTICSLFVLAYCKPLHRFILNTGINIGAKIKLIKNPEQKRKDLTVQVATFRIELKRLMSNFWALIIVVILLVAKMTLLNSLPYFAGEAMGADMSGKYFQCLWSNSYLTMITCFIPIPGASGGAELAYQLLFSHIYENQAILSASNLLWRGISYYFGLILGGVIFASYHESPKAYAIKADTRTFIDLEIIAMANSVEEMNTYNMLTKRDAKHQAKLDEEKRRSRLILDADAVKQSFANINELLNNRTDEEAIDDGIDEQTFERTRKYLKIVAKETELQADETGNAAREEAVQKEIESDSIALQNSIDRKNNRKHKGEKK